MVWVVWMLRGPHGRIQVLPGDGLDLALDVEHGLGTLDDLLPTGVMRCRCLPRRSKMRTPARSPANRSACSPQADWYRAHREATETLRLWSRTAIRYFNCCSFKVAPTGWRGCRAWTQGRQRWRPVYHPSWAYRRLILHFATKSSISAVDMTNGSPALCGPDRQYAEELQQPLHHGGGVHLPSREERLLW